MKMQNEEAPTRIEAVAVKTANGIWNILPVRFNLDTNDNFRTFYPTFLYIGGVTLRLLKVTPRGRIMYEQVVE